MSERVTIGQIKKWANDDSSWANTLEAINASSLVRIANSMETVAKRHTELISERDYYYAEHKRQVGKREALERKVAALKGVITKLKVKRREPAQ